MGWTITENGNRLDVAIDGRFVAAVAPAAREEIISRMRDGMNVLFDLGKMLHIDSSGIGVLVQVLQKAKSHGGRVVLVAPWRRSSRKPMRRSRHHERRAIFNCMVCRSSVNLLSKLHRTLDSL